MGLGPVSTQSNRRAVPLNKFTGTVGDDSKAAFSSSEDLLHSPPSCSPKCQSWGSSPGAGLQSPCSNCSPTRSPAVWVVPKTRISVIFNVCPKWETPDFSPTSFLQNFTHRFWAFILNPFSELFPLFFWGGKRSLSPRLSPSTCKGCSRDTPHTHTHSSIPAALPLMSAWTKCSVQIFRKYWNGTFQSSRPFLAHTLPSP